MNFISTDLDYLIVGTHFISIFLIGAIIFQQYRWQKKHGFINIRIMGIVIYSILLTLFSLAPVLLSAIFVTYSII